MRRSVLTTASLTATLLGFAFHTAALSQRWTEAGHFPAVGLRDGASVLAWAIVLVLPLVYVTTRVIPKRRSRVGRRGIREKVWGLDPARCAGSAAPWPVPRSRPRYAVCATQQP